VELTLIKLCYLQQALELVNNDGTVSKKKVVEGTKTVAFRALPIIRVPEKKVLENGTAAKPVEQTSETKLIIQEPSVNIAKPVSQPTTLNPVEPKPSLASLQKIRQQVKQQNQSFSDISKILNEEELHAAWGLFIEELRKKANHSAVTNFKLAELKVLNENAIEIIVSGEIQKAFIETERAALVTHLQTYFNNRQLTYQVTVVEKMEDKEPVEKKLNTKEQYLKIIEEYPLVKELKERLKLDLDY
jgi:DNA polymerase III subunit gamma/tau